MPLLSLPVLLPPLLPLQLICAALGGWLFREKRRPVWAGVLLGLVFGLVGLVVAAALPAEPREPRQSAQA
jgi:4-hydroxybenzoate polyprenyltransferase